jgi:large subunit ribosomal protein L29
MKSADLREKSVDDLRELEKTLARDVFQNRLKNFTNRLDDTSAMRKTRRDLARVVTLIHERDLGLQRGPRGESPAGSVEAAKPAAPPPAEAKTAPKKSSAKAKQKSEAKQP